MLDVIGCEDVCGDRLCKYMGCRMNNKQCVTVSCWVTDCKVREEVDNSTGNSNTLFIIHLTTHLFAWPISPQIFTANHIMHLPMVTLRSIDQSNRSPGFLHVQRTKTNHLTTKMASAQVVETSVTNNSTSQDSNHSDDLVQSRYVTSGFKPSGVTKPFSRLHSIRNFIPLPLWSPGILTLDNVYHSPS